VGGMERWVRGGEMGWVSGGVGRDEFELGCERVRGLREGEGVGGK